MSFSVRHIPALVVATGLTFGGLIPFSFFSAEYACQAFGFPNELPLHSLSQPAQSVMILNTARAALLVKEGGMELFPLVRNAVYDRDIRLRARVFFVGTCDETTIRKVLCQPVLVAKEIIVPLISLRKERHCGGEVFGAIEQEDWRIPTAFNPTYYLAVRVAVNRTNMGTLPLHAETALREQHEDGVAKKSIFFANTFIFGAIEQEEYRHFNNFRTRVVRESRVNRGSAWCQWWDNTAKCGDKEDRHREL
ncbi:hypothetical protein B0H11DRAFT_1899569 [Mycena galericulata]|nr:hypothetical protein B0H11DRAFT_1899569 [Mycena galericulata]